MSKVYWRMTSDQFKRFKSVSDRMIQAAMDNNTLAQQEAEDEFRSLPGMPRNINLDHDLVVPLITDKPSSLTVYATLPKTKEYFQ